MKAVLMSIKPKWCELIASGKKTVEVRKNRPKLETPFKVYIYCTIDGGVQGDMTVPSRLTCGKVIGEFVCYSIYESEWFLSPDHPQWQDRFDDESCLTDRELYDYSKGGTFYGWHISDLVIYDKPKELGEFWNADKCPYASKDGCTYKYHCFRTGQAKRCGDTLTRPPQSWAYVEEVRR